MYKKSILEKGPKFILTHQIHKEALLQGWKVIGYQHWFVIFLPQKKTNHDYYSPKLIFPNLHGNLMRDIYLNILNMNLQNQVCS